MSNHRRLPDALWLLLRPARWSIFGFRFLPWLLFAAGCWAVVYGGFYHRIPVTETHDEQISIAVPAPWSPPPQPGGPSGMGPFSPDAFGPPPMKFIQAVKTVRSTIQERESAINRAVTIAGVIRDPQGEIMRVGGAAGGPAYCPT
jgi:hypothetical protein